MIELKGTSQPLNPYFFKKNERIIGILKLMINSKYHFNSNILFSFYYIEQKRKICFFSEINLASEFEIRIHASTMSDILKDKKRYINFDSSNE
ncbi:hypothetical protein BpHYR1_044567 [Brachionus plicatilis]|uniref:Uncharacterized protein n=1 Tax=Brachionus plicatilis TaxID=10195 RepID=A0A3M7R143_BRAPC|nr:hypothetical protein BpHYR1_044567 [Brachionus plicatilis]